ncbi:hypothetical protein I3760_11G103200 [Carya illinoinensis]|uniref:Zinc finger GRF-type domain-containing protein n=1 Tax=Carya illinoinensis TaxID=32201 RepID=A0A8T1P4M8_CARIL|nr:hypothetical protein I3760_11G103200 [Carya illinoinensis]KAG6636353.1 hypothetical protein CIPAW_11G105400 [Carya illinoinensis]
MSTGSSSTSWGGKAPLDSPFCHCKLRARLRVLTMDYNYKRKFWRCPSWTPGSQNGIGDRFCTFFDWVDDDFCSICGDVLGQLRDRLQIRSREFKIEKSELEANLVMEKERREHIQELCNKLKEKSTELESNLVMEKERSEHIQEFLYKKKEKSKDLCKKYNNCI